MSLVVMYFLAFSQIDLLDHFKWSLSVFWITLSVVSAMALIMLVAMWSMLENTRLDFALLVIRRDSRWRILGRPHRGARPRRMIERRG